MSFSANKLNQSETAAILKDSNPIQITNQSREMVAPMRAKRKDVNRFWNPKNEGGIALDINIMYQ